MIARRKITVAITLNGSANARLMRTVPASTLPFILIRVERTRKGRRVGRRLSGRDQRGKESEQAQHEKQDEAVHGDAGVMTLLKRKIKPLPVAAAGPRGGRRS
jgi:hypothetical protein